MGTLILKEEFVWSPTLRPFRKYLKICFTFWADYFSKRESWINFLPNDPSLGEGFLPRKIGQETQKGGGLVPPVKILTFLTIMVTLYSKHIFYTRITKKNELNAVMNCVCATMVMEQIFIAGFPVKSPSKLIGFSKIRSLWSLFALPAFIRCTLIDIHLWNIYWPQILKYLTFC